MIKGTLRQTLLALLVFSAPGLTQAQSAPEVECCYGDFSDLSAFGEAIGDRRIVLLDELTHGERENFALKARLVRYLHQKKGFDALVIESGLFDVAQIWQQPDKSIRVQAPGNIFYMYANSAPVRSLFDYIDAQRNEERPLELAGFDGRLSGEYSLARVSTFIQQQSEAFAPQVSARMDWQQYLEITQAVLARNSGSFTEVQKNGYIDSSYGLIDTLQQVRTNVSGYERPDYVARLIHGLVIVAQNLWGSRRHDEHDIAMAENLQWLLDTQLKDKKIIVWGQFIHLNYGGTVTQRYDNLGTLLRRQNSADMYLAHIAASDGQYRDFVDMQVKDIEGAGTLNMETQILHNANFDSDSVIFLDGEALDNLTQSAADESVFFGLQYANNIDARDWRQYWDGMFILPLSSPSGTQPEDEPASSQ